MLLCDYNNATQAKKLDWNRWDCRVNIFNCMFSSPIDQKSNLLCDSLLIWKVNCRWKVFVRLLREIGVETLSYLAQLRIKGSDFDTKLIVLYWSFKLQNYWSIAKLLTFRLNNTQDLVRNWSCNTSGNKSSSPTFQNSKIIDFRTT